MIYRLSTWILPLLICMIFHEVAHGYMALKLGDDTAKRAGRLTLNPIPHIDPIGSILVPLMMLLMSPNFLFGWAKPVPVRFGNLHRPKRDMGWVAAAGPISNLLLAIFFALILKVCLMLLPDGPFLMWMMENLTHGIMLSLVIGIFNLIPILPLDGGRIVVSLLPINYAIRYQSTEKYGFFILFGVIFLSQVSGINVIGWFVDLFYPQVLKIVMLFM